MFEIGLAVIAVAVVLLLVARAMPNKAERERRRELARRIADRDYRASEARRHAE